MELGNYGSQVGPINGRKWILIVDFEALYLGLRLIVLKALLVLERLLFVDDGGDQSLAQTVVSVHIQRLVFLVCWIRLEQDHLAFDLREGMGNQNVVFVELFHFVVLLEFELARVRDLEPRLEFEIFESLVSSWYVAGKRASSLSLFIQSRQPVCHHSLCLVFVRVPSHSCGSVSNPGCWIDLPFNVSLILPLILFIILVPLDLGHGTRFSR